MKYSKVFFQLFLLGIIVLLFGCTGTKDRPADLTWPTVNTAITLSNIDRLEQLTSLGKGRVYDISYSSDGDFFAVATSLGLYLYDAHSLMETRFFPTQHNIRDLDFSSDGKTHASSNSNGEILIWNVKNGNLLHTLDGNDRHGAIVTLSPNGTKLALGYPNGEILIWDVKTGELLNTMEGHNVQIKSIAFSPDGTMLASGAKDGSVRLWQVDTGQTLRILDGHEQSTPFSIKFSPDGTTLVSAFYERLIVWQVSDGLVLQTLNLNMGDIVGITSIDFSPDGTILASGTNDGTIRLWQVSTGQVLYDLPVNLNDEVLSVDFSSDGEILASGTSNEIQFWQVSDGKLLQTIKDHIENPWDIAFSPDETNLAIGATRTVYFWQNDGQLRTLPDNLGVVWSLAFSPDETMLATGSTSGEVQTWQWVDGQHLRSFEGNTDYVASLAFSPDGTILAFGEYPAMRTESDTDFKVWLFQANDGQLLHTLSGHKSPVDSLSFSPNGEILAVSSDKLIRLWQVSNGKLLKNFAAHSPTLARSGGLTPTITNVAFSPDGMILAAGAEDGTVRLWNIDDERLLREFEVPDGASGGLAFSPDGTILVSSSIDIVQLWQVSDGELIRTLEGHKGPSRAVFSPSGYWLATSSDDGMVKLWGIPPTN